jgi:SAM-dependent methyltransferase
VGAPAAGPQTKLSRGVEQHTACWLAIPHALVAQLFNLLRELIKILAPATNYSKDPGDSRGSTARAARWATMPTMLPAEFRWSGGAAYDGYVGRWSRLVAAEFIPWLDVSGGATWIDVGCGTGQLTRSILRIATPSRVVSLDPSESYLEHARASTKDKRADFRRGTDQDVRSLGVVADAVVSGLVLNFVPDAGDALRGFAGAIAPGGLVAAYVWDYADGMSMLRHFWDAAMEEDPAARSKDEGARFPICAPGALATAFETAGLSGVATRPIDVTDKFADFDQYWTPFLSGGAPAPGYLASLPAERKARLREIVRNRLPIATDGSITLTCRAWAVRGRRPLDG